MKKALLNFCLVFGSLAAFAGSQAQAGLWVQSAISVSQLKQDFGAPDGASQSLSETRFLNSTTLGVSLLEGLLVGGQFLASNNTRTHDRTFAYGPKGGILLKGFEVTGAYLPFAEDVRGTDQRTGGGFSLSSGYTFGIAGPFRAGFHATYWYIRFDRLNGAELAVKQRVSQIAPQLSVALLF